ncbi:MAG: TolC family protein [Acidobacteria bacterium]|nr:TolC family protein [Acidobacteriota bacterium]
MSSKKEITFVLLLLIFMIPTLLAQQPLTLQQALEQAPNNSFYQALLQRAEALKGKLQQAGKRPNPELESETDSNSDGTDHLVSVVLLQKWERGGKRGLRQQIAQADLEEAELAAEDYLRVLNAEIRTAYLDLLRIEQRGKLHDTHIEKINTLIKLDEARVREGEIPNLNLDYLRVHLARRTIRRQSNQHKLTLYRLNTAIGAPLETEYVLQDNGEGKIPLPPAGQAINFALKNRPDLKKLRAAVERAQYEINMQNAVRKRDWNVALGYHRIRSTISRDDIVPTGLLQTIKDTSDLMELRLAIPIPLWDDNSGNISAALTTKKATQSELAQAEVAVRAAVLTAYQQYELAQRTDQLYHESFLPKVEETLGRLETAYQLTGEGLRDWISDQGELLDSALLRVETDFEMRKAVVELEKQIGGSLPQMMQTR